MAHGVNVCVFVSVSQPCDELRTCPGCNLSWPSVSCGRLHPLWPVKDSVVENGQFFWWLISYSHDYLFHTQMCVSRCLQCVGLSLLPLAIICMLSNILLLLPDLSIQHLLEGHVTREAKWSTGLWGSGFLVCLHTHTQHVWYITMCKSDPVVVTFHQVQTNTWVLMTDFT